MNTAKIFVTGRSQAVRLPKEFRFDAEEVCVAKVDDMVILYPRDKGWDLLERGLERFTEDYMHRRELPGPAERRKAL
jgi:antitoxin VapB